MSLAKYDVSKWIENNQEDFKPPVCNKCLFSKQLLAFLVGGPNSRNDFHLEEGEELFYMVRGDMCLKTVNNGKIEDIIIKEGQIYLQPERVLHSPQRKAETVGLVVERSRNPQELDCLRFFDDESSLSVSFERWFHMKDAVADLPPIIFEYLETQKLRKENGVKTVNTNLIQSPYEAHTDLVLGKPFYLADWIEKHAAQIRENGSLLLYGRPHFRSTVKVYGPGMHSLIAGAAEIFVWLLKGNGAIFTEDEEQQWNAVEATLVPPYRKVVLLNNENSYCLTVQMPTPAV